MNPYLAAAFALRSLEGASPRASRYLATVRRATAMPSPESSSAMRLSDSRIAELLSGEGIAVARRTVAKYREALGLAPSNERKAKAAGNS